MNISWSNFGGHDKCLGGPGLRVPLRSIGPVSTSLFIFFFALFAFSLSLSFFLAFLLSKYILCKESVVIMIINRIRKLAISLSFEIL